MAGMLHWNEVHPRTPRRLTDRFGVIAIIFAAFDIGLDVLWRDKTHRMAERGQFPSPTMRAAAGFQGDDSGRELAEERVHLRATKVGAQDRPSFGDDVGQAVVDNDFHFDVRVVR